MIVDLIIRPATDADADAITRLAGELGYVNTVETMRARIATAAVSPADLLMVAVDASDEAIGWMHAHAAQPIESEARVEIFGLIVAPGARRAGVGRALVAEAERWATSLGVRAVIVRSNTVRVESHAFYPALGYTESKTQRVYRKDL